MKRLLVSGRIFYVTVNLRKNLRRFTEPGFSVLAATIEQSRRKLDFSLSGYVFMPDHWHALIGVKHPLTISRVVQDIKWSSARRLNASRTTTGPLWQHQFWDRFIRHEKEFGHRLAYMHLNPLRKGLVSRPEDWRWSSYNNFALDPLRVAQCPIQIDYVDFPMS